MTHATPRLAITRINPPELGTLLLGSYSQIVEAAAGLHIFIAGQTALDRRGPRGRQVRISLRKPIGCFATPRHRAAGKRLHGRPIW